MIGSRLLIDSKGKATHSEVLLLGVQGANFVREITYPVGGVITCDDGGVF